MSSKQAKGQNWNTTNWVVMSSFVHSQALSWLRGLYFAKGGEEVDQY